MADKTFRQVILEATKDADLNVRQRVKLRLVLRFCEDRLATELFQQAQVEGFIPVTAAIGDSATTEGIDWDGLADFIKEILPIILEVIKLFL